MVELRSDEVRSRIQLSRLSDVALEKRTKICRRQIERLRKGKPKGKPARTRLSTVKALAAAIGCPVGELIGPASTPKSLGLHATRVRGGELADAWLSAAGGHASNRVALLDDFAALLEFDRWSHALAPAGTTIINEKGPRSRTIAKIEDRRVRFAHHLADALAVLAEPFAAATGVTLQTRNAESLRLQLRRLLREAERLAVQGQDPTLRSAVAEATGSLVAATLAERRLAAMRQRNAAREETALGVRQGENDAASAGDRMRSPDHQAQLARWRSEDLGKLTGKQGDDDPDSPKQNAQYNEDKQ